VSFAAITLCVASRRVFIVVSVYFVIDSVRKLLDTTLYLEINTSSVTYRKIKIKILKKTMILPTFLYGCETWSLTVSEENTLRVFENRVLRGVFGHEEVGSNRKQEKNAQCVAS
jgi:hypothetical protein